MSWWNRTIDRMRGTSGAERDADGPQSGRVATGGELAVGMTDSSLPAGAGGPSHLVEELSTLRWVAQQEAVNIANGGIDPAAWPNGEMAFHHELASAHSHAQLRDRMGDLVTTNLTEQAGTLHQRAGDVAKERAHLDVLDAELTRKQAEHDRLHELVSGNDHELGRFNRISHLGTRNLKWLIAAVLITTEVFISARPFDEALGLGWPWLIGGIITSTGLMVLLITVPHFVAQGLKEGITEYHRFDRDHATRHGHELTADQERNVHLEEQEDRGYRWVSVFLLTVLLALIVPLSFVRASHVGDGGWEWISLFFFLQCGISGYFFLREWNDLSNLTESLKSVTEARDELAEDRSEAYEAYIDAVTGFTSLATTVTSLASRAASWDRQIVDGYRATVEHFRATMATVRPELGPFLFHAQRWDLDEVAAGRGWHGPQTPTATHISTHDAPAISPSDRAWRLQRLGQSLQGGSTEGGPAEAQRWLETGAPMEFLTFLMETLGGLRVDYANPSTPGSTDGASADQLSLVPRREVTL